MFILDSVNCGNDYTDAATISNVYNSSGGYFAITGSDAYARLIYGRHGQPLETAEFHVPVGNGILYPGTVGIKFRNYTAGSIAVVSAALSLPSEPPVALSAGGISTPAAATMLTGRVAATGAVTQGSGFTVTKTGTGAYTVTFAVAFSVAPVPVITPGNAGGAPDVLITGCTATQMTLLTFVSTTGVAQDSEFYFLVATTA